MENRKRSSGESVVQVKKYLLKLFITGSTTRSITAVNNITTICKNHLDNDYDLQIIDIYDNPELAREDHIIAIPTLVKVFPRPAIKFIGDLAQTEKVLSGLGLL